MHLIIVLALIAKLALVSGDCDVGNTVKDFDYTKFTGEWFFLYYVPNENDDALECPFAYFGDPVDNVSAITTHVYDKRERKELNITGYAYDWDNCGFFTKFMAITQWTGRFNVLAVDYEGYVIGKDESETFSGLLIYVAFRRPDPDEETQKNMENALHDNDIDIKQLRSWNADRCLQFQ